VSINERKLYLTPKSPYLILKRVKLRSKAFVSFVKCVKTKKNNMITYSIQHIKINVIKKIKQHK
jgi:hypothetical protein